MITRLQTYFSQPNRARSWLKGLLVFLSPFLLFILLNIVFPLPDRVEYSTIITDRKGEVIHAFLCTDQQWRMKTELEEISPLLQKAIVAKEDKWFYRHPGVNPLAIGRAVFNNVATGRRTSGASTITMQVAKLLEPKRRTYLNKLVEVFRAFQLEWKYSKQEILQLYLNLLPYGGNIQGVKSAAVIYFRKNPDHLSLAEIMALAVIPNRPGSLVIGRNNPAIVDERNRWLGRFREEGHFSGQDIRDALEEPLVAERHAVPRLAPHLAYKLKQSGQVICHSTIELNTQLKAEKIVADYIRGQRLQGIRNAAAMIIDNRSHKVVAYIGSADFYDTTDAGQVNGAAAVRQPGSTLKPLLYGLCMDGGLMTPRLMISDVSVNYNGYMPENYDKEFNGNVTMEYALDHSLNIPAVKALSWYGKDRFIAKLLDCRFEQVRKDQRKLGLSMILGGCGATLEELTAVFAAFATRGDYYPLQYLEQDSSAKPGRARKKQLVSQASAYLLSEMLSKVNRPDFPLNWQSTEKMPKIAWKTGTSYGRRDAWSIGYNKDYTIGVWVGNFSGVGVPGLSGAEVATPLLFRLFNTVDYDNEGEWFEVPNGLDSRIVCEVSGKVPGEHCTNLVTDHFIPLVSGTETCEHLIEVAVDEKETRSYCRNCMPEAGYRKLLYPNLGPEMQSWMEERKIVFKRIPPHNPDCEMVFREGAPRITSLSANEEYLIDQSDPEPLQLACRTGSDVSRVYWYINDQYYKSASPGSSIFFMPSEGPVKISCTDDKGRNTNLWIRVRMVAF
ncbi:penicillin-binding protein 1C [Flavihumibacter rivuli]|uniref:penicillin-binding protein 1C n=1 Tax=Flavihumibacter rivuli TaxID=2838156 RepID=UPI001BDF2E90|nr:penicillin-binding protein 1C [Flavihumibacter rivuli]ULQ55927.1 penicillin-binding protein 1C [Flavihumibacter rivuli]